ncbi:hypothetical protein ACIBP6_19580 [Nonomuraea terrae]|uniref:hypothetical protein n=1 Tax=Nonomuraea terrae TaxID=2530383 RepID=UPI0037A51137
MLIEPTTAALVAVVVPHLRRRFRWSGAEAVIRWEWWRVVSSLLGRLQMPSVVGLLEQHELAARRRVDGLREEADRIQAELAAAEQEWQEWAIARRRVGTVLAPDSGNIAAVVPVSGEGPGLF